MRRATFACAAALIGGGLALPAPALAVDSPSPQTFTTQSAAPPAAKKTTKSKARPSTTAKKEKRSDIEFRKGYQRAHARIYERQDYAGGIIALRALHRDDHPDVANLVGFASRKLGRTDDAKVWYEKALAADPNHSRTWSYYGMWHAEQGNLLKAQDHLEKVRTLCGTSCRDYVQLQAVIKGTGTY